MSPSRLHRDRVPAHCDNLKAAPHEARDDERKSTIGGSPAHRNNPSSYEPCAAAEAPVEWVFCPPTPATRDPARKVRPGWRSCAATARPKYRRSPNSVEDEGVMAKSTQTPDRRRSPMQSLSGR